VITAYQVVTLAHPPAFNFSNIEFNAHPSVPTTGLDLILLTVLTYVCLQKTHSALISISVCHAAGAVRAS
jgi:hypothetical protein